MIIFDDGFRTRLLELFTWRRDVRRFRPDPLPPGTLERLIHIACLSPSVGLFGRQELTFGLLLLPGVGIGYATAPLVGRFVDRRRLRIAILTISGASAIALALR